MGDEREESWGTRGWERLRKMRKVILGGGGKRDEEVGVTVQETPSR